MRPQHENTTLCESVCVCVMVSYGGSHGGNVAVQFSVTSREEQNLAQPHSCSPPGSTTHLVSPLSSGLL